VAVVRQPKEKKKAAPQPIGNHFSVTNAMEGGGFLGSGKVKKEVITKKWKARGRGLLGVDGRPGPRKRDI